jgi:general secretion pathway protein H
LGIGLTATVSKKAGFTLIEILVVMLLITIVFAVTIPRLDSGLVESSKKKTTRWVVNAAGELRGLSVEKQKEYALMVDLGRNRMWFIHADMDEEALAAASEKAFAMPRSIRIVDIQFPDKERITSGTTQIAFYPSGYSDYAVINLQDDGAQRFAYKIEPLLPKVTVVDQWLEF